MGTRHWPEDAIEEVERLERDYKNACGLVAKMHAAAVGEITGPKRGVVEDVEDLRKQRDELLAVFSLVIDEIEKRDRGNGNAPGHGHDVPGVWDSDNGVLAGKPCAWCATWAKAKELRAELASAKEVNHGN